MMLYENTQCFQWWERNPRVMVSNISFGLLTLGNWGEMIQFDWHRFFKWLGYGEGRG